MGFHSTDIEDLGLPCYYAEFPATQSNNPEGRTSRNKSEDHLLTYHEGTERR